MKLSKKKIQQARRISQKRSKHAQDVDKSELSKITFFPEVYRTDPSRFDFPFVDTPKYWNGKQKRRSY